LLAALENGEIFKKDVLDIDDSVYINNLKSAYLSAFNLAFNTAYPTRINIKLLIKKAFLDSNALADSKKIMTSESIKKEEKPTVHNEVRPRPELTHGTTRKMHTGCGNLYVTINEDDKGKPFELFSQMGKGGGCAASQCEAISRLISYSLRMGMNLQPIMKQLKGISCHKPAWDNGNKIVSCADAIGMSIERYLGEKGFQKDIDAINRDVQNGCIMGACPDCGGTLEHQSGCVSCRICGYSECL